MLLIFSNQIFILFKVLIFSFNLIWENAIKIKKLNDIFQIQEPSEKG